MFIKKIKNLESLPLVIMLVFIFFFLFTNFAQSKDIYFGATASDNIRVVGKLCIAGTCYASWPANPWSVSGTRVYYNVANGNVGIGKTNPTKTLDVTGTADFSGLVTAMTPQSPQGGQLATVEYVTSATAGMASYWTANGINIYSNNSGNIGIGVTSPAAKLQINPGSGKEGLRIIAGNYSPLVVRNTANNADLLRFDETGKLILASSIKIGDSLLACDSTNSGTVKHDPASGQTYICNGIMWLNQNNCGMVSDEDGNRYGTVQIGGQCWMTENMRVGTMLASVATNPNTADNIIEKWCYDNDPSICETEGGLYHWEEAMRGSTVPGAQGICPTGWHIPTDAEINILERTVQGIISSSASQYPCDLNSTGYQRCADNNGTNQGANGVGQALRRTDKGSGVGKGTDLVGFKGDLPGYRYTGSTFYLRGSYLYLWSSSPSGSSAWLRYMGSSYSTVYRSTSSKASGFSVRCVKNAEDNQTINLKSYGGTYSSNFTINKDDASSIFSGSTLFTVLQGGNVGIGIDQPIHKLSVAGTAYFSGITTGMTPTSEQKDSLITVEYLDAFKDDLLAQLGLCGGKIADEDGNRYGTVQIGGQCWMTENMRVGTMLASGATMPTTGDNIIEKWCYNNDPNLCETEGGLYHWDEAMRGSTEPGAQGICPTGWHIPTDQEWNDLEQYVVSVIASPNNQYPCDLNSTGYQRCADNTGTDQGANGVGQALRRTDKGSGVGKGTDLVGFKGDLPGYRGTGSTFYRRGSRLVLWSSSLYGSSAWRRDMDSSYSAVYRTASSKPSGFSVRCLRD